MIQAHTCDKGFSKTRLAVQLEIQRRTGKANSFIDSKPDCPPELLYLWDLYNKVLKGCDKIGYLELQAFNQVSKFDLNSQEIDVLIEIDILRRKNNGH